MKCRLDNGWQKKLSNNHGANKEALSMGHSTPCIVSIKDVCHRYPKASSDALKTINLSISEGSCFGLLGPNGAGKTTLISLLTGIIKMQQGNIRIAGFNIPHAANNIKRISGLVPQDYAFYPALTGRENLIFFAGLYQIPAKILSSRLEYCVTVCGLEKVLDQRVATYSGGVKRRLNIALGLLHDPKILYLDEPTVGIDTQSRYFILETIKQLKANGMTIVYTSHYMEEVEQVCDEVAVIDNGQVLFQEAIGSLLGSEKKLIIVPVASLDQADLQKLRSMIDFEWDGKKLTLSTLEGKPLSQLLAMLESVGVEINTLSYGASRLEEKYLQATHRELRQ